MAGALRGAYRSLQHLLRLGSRLVGEGGWCFRISGLLRMTYQGVRACVRACACIVSVSCARVAHAMYARTEGNRAAHLHMHCRLGGQCYRRAPFLIRDSLFVSFLRVLCTPFPVPCPGGIAAELEKHPLLVFNQEAGARETTGFFWPSRCRRRVQPRRRSRCETLILRWYLARVDPADL